MSGKPAARVGDMHLCPKVEPGPTPHVGGPVLPPGEPTVLIGGMPAARVGDKLVCIGPPDTISAGSATVLIGGKPAARMGDSTEHGGKIVIGFPTVLIGDDGGGAASSSAATAGAAASGATSSGQGAESTGPTHGSPCSAGEPVDLISGKVYVDQEDFTLPWRVPFAWKRFYNSASRRRGALGVGWESAADFRLSLRDSGEVAFWGGTPGALCFSHLPAVGDSVLHPVEGATLLRSATDLSVITRASLIYTFLCSDSPVLPRELPLESIHGLSGNRIIFKRQDGLLVQILEATGPWLELIHDDQRLKRVVLHHPDQPDRLLVRYEHASDEDLTAVFDPLGVPHTFDYRAHCLVTHTDRHGVAFNYQYDEETPVGRCLSTSGANGLFAAAITYDPENRLTRSTDSCGQITTAEYDAQNRLLRRTSGPTETTSYQYDSDGRTIAVTDPLGRRTAYDYDARGNLVALTRPDGVILRWEYDERSNPIAFTDAAGQLWRQEFDNCRRLLSQASPLGATRRYRYNERGDLTDYIDPLGTVTRFESTPHGTSLIGLTDPLRHRSAWQVDSLGHILAATDPLGATTRYQYDAKGRLTDIETPTGAKLHCAYDAELNLTAYTDALGQTTRFEYGPLGILLARHLPNATTVRYEYDAENRLIAVINGRGEKYTLKRDQAGRLAAETDYWGATTRYDYDPAGQLLARTDPLGQRIAYDRDPLGRLLARHFTDGTSERFAYDASGNLVLTETPQARIERTFDADGRMASEQQNKFNVRYTHDAAGRVLRRDSTAGNQIDYSYDPAGRLATIKANGHPILNIQRDPRGLPLSERLGPQLQRYFEFDTEHRLIGQRISAGAASRALADRCYTYDAAGHLIQRTDTAKGTEHFAYDPVGQLLRRTAPSGQIEEFLRDAAGDFLATGTPDKPKDEPNETANSTSPAHSASVRFARLGQTDFRFDAAGRVLERRTRHGRTRFEWDGADRLTRARNEQGIVTTFTYDAQGRRLAKNSNRNDVQFGWDGDALMAELDSQKGWREYVYQPGGYAPVALIEADRVYHFENDQAGVPQTLFANDGTPVWSATYNAWGGATNLHTTKVANPLRLQGQYADDELGIAYNRNRYYDPNTGAFLSQDPLGMAAGANLYAMAPNTQSWADPLGLSCTPATTNAAASGNPMSIRFTQPTVSQNFSTGQTLTETANALRSVELTATDLPTIRVVEQNGRLFTLDNRRLVAFQNAGLTEIPIQRVPLSDPAIMKEFLRKFNPVNGGQSIVVTPNAAGRGTAEAVLRQYGKIK